MSNCKEVAEIFEEKAQSFCRTAECKFSITFFYYHDGQAFLQRRQALTLKARLQRNTDFKLHI